MSKTSFDSDGNRRVTSDDGRSSWLHEPSDSVWGGRGKCTEVADHHEDGTTTAYEYEHSIFGDGKGKKK